MNNSSKAKLFLMEFIFVVFMLAVCAVICVSVFVKTDHVSRMATAKNEGILIAEAVIEQVKAVSTGDEEKIFGAVSKIVKETNYKYDKEYSVSVNYDIKDRMLRGKCVVKSKVLGKICELPLTKYVVELNGKEAYKDNSASDVVINL